MSRRKNASTALVVVWLAAGARGAGAAPRITETLGPSPAHAQHGATIGMFAQGLSAPVRVFFSDGSNPTVEATPVAVDLSRGMVLARVPPGAVTGAMKVTAAGLDSSPYYFRVDAGTFDPGTATLSGQITSGVTPVVGAVVVLLAFDACDHDTLWDHAITDATGHYSVVGKNGQHMIFVFPPVSSGLAGGGAPVPLSPSPSVANVALSAGIVVSGRVVRASSPATGVVDTRIQFESDAGFDTRLTDASGNFSVRLTPGIAEARIHPPSTQVLASTRQSFVVPPAGPQTVPDIALQGGVRISGTARAANGLAPMPNVEINAQVMNSCCDNADEVTAEGDGSFSLVVPSGQTYQLYARVDDRAAYADQQLMDVVVASADVTRNMDLQDAGLITGTALDASTGGPIPDLGIQALVFSSSYQMAAFARTCSDGTYRLRVPPNATGYFVTAANSEDNGYVPTTWNGGPAGTFFPCEGSAVTVPSAGSQAGSINFSVHSGASAVSGSFVTQSSGCTGAAGGQFWANVDDGSSHQCSMGMTDWNSIPGSYRVYGLPSSQIVATLRVCVSSTSTTSGQCWDGRKTGSSFDPVAVASGQTSSGIDFCVGNVPGQQTQGLRASKAPGGVTFTWTPATDVYQTSYRLRGASTVRPTTAPGSFPADPGFTAVYDGPATSAFVPLAQIFSYYLVTNVGPTGVDGPAGSYAP